MYGNTQIFLNSFLDYAHLQVLSHQLELMVKSFF